jgi:ABC-type multidrug transport system fused ATPase/permease subunit
MDDGRILEDGSFEDLMNSDGKLADMMRNYRVSNFTVL